MTKVFDNWERLVKGTLRREQLRLTGISHERQSTSISFMLQAADDIQPEDVQVARILCETAYNMVQNLDPNSEGRGALQFNTGITCVIKQKLAKNDGRTIDRKCDAQHLWNFYQHYKRKHKVDEIQKEEHKMLQSGTFSADIGLSEKVRTVLRAVVAAMEALNEDDLSDGVGREIAEEGEKGLKAMDAIHGSPLEFGPTTTPLPDKKLLVFILERLQKEDTYGVFSDPVDPNELPDYHEIVKQPMDFGTLGRKLDGGRYANLEELEADVYLICSNAMQYNSSDTIFFRQARSIQELAKRDFEKLRQEGEDEHFGWEKKQLLALKRLKLEDGNKTDGKEVKLEDAGKQGKEEGSTSRPKEWQYLEISLEEIKQASKNFQDCIGKGGYGLVYKGKLYKSGKPIPVAIKRLNEQFGQGLKEFLTEIQLLYGKKHPNLISLLGYCEEDKEKILVYEYAQRGSLDQYLRHDNTTNYTLTWHQRLKICAGAARGLDHLHHHFGKHIRIIHRDIKSANILLDENWVAKISDFGLSKLSLAGLDRSTVISHPCGTMGYCEPEYMITGILSKESDVYSFGIVLFEVLCRRLCIIKDNDGVLLSGPLAKEFYERKRLEEIIDPSLKEHFSSDSTNKFSEIAYRCLHYDRKQRPPMDLVVKELEDLLEMEV